MTRYDGLLLMALGCVAMSLVWLAHLRVENARERADVRAEMELIQKNIAKLSLEYGNMTRPERLRRLAHQKLGMNAPTPSQVIRR